jgi:hypothetical protein
VLIGQSPVLGNPVLGNPGLGNLGLGNLGLGNLGLGNLGLGNLGLHPRACADFEVSQGLGQVPCRNIECMQGVFDISVELIF